MVTLTEDYFSVDMELSAAHIHYTRAESRGTIRKANTFMQTFRKFLLKKYKFILLINVFLDVTLLNA